MKLLRICLLFVLLACLAVGCCRPCHNYAVVGADEFVMDSYKIRQGKSAILEMEGICVGDLPYDAMEEYKDVIAEDDILNIVLYHPTRKDLMESIQFVNSTVGGFRVHKGEVDLPDIASTHVAGLTLDEARDALQAAFDAQIRDTELFVSYKDRLARRVELAGLTAVDTVPVDGRIRLYEVLAKARPLSQHVNLFMSYVLRDGHPLAIDFHRLMNSGDMSQNIVMRGGDKVFLAPITDAQAMIMGEVNFPTSVPLPYGSMPLREALAYARGIPFTGDARNIQIIRGNIPCPKIYVLSWEHIVHLPNDSLLLMPGDTVYITDKPITKWNRFIGQLLPSLQSAGTAYGLYRLTNN